MPEKVHTHCALLNEREGLWIAFGFEASFTASQIKPDPVAQNTHSKLPIGFNSLNPIGFTLQA